MKTKMWKVTFKKLGENNEVVVVARNLVDAIKRAITTNKNNSYCKWDLMYNRMQDIIKIELVAEED